MVVWTSKVLHHHTTSKTCRNFKGREFSLRAVYQDRARRLIVCCNMDLWRSDEVHLANPILLWI